MKVKTNITTLTIKLREDEPNKDLPNKIGNFILSKGFHRPTIESHTEAVEIEEVVSLRNYMKEHACGAYHRFKFTIMDHTITVMDVADFVSIYNEKLLDEYFVEDDRQVDNGGNCESYLCIHYLTLSYGGSNQ